MATGISGNVIVGNSLPLSSTGVSQFQAVLYNGSTWTTLDDPDGEPGTTVAAGITGNTVVGDYTDAKGLPHGFVYNGSTWTTLDDPGAACLFRGPGGRSCSGAPTFPYDQRLTRDPRRTPMVRALPDSCDDH